MQLEFGPLQQTYLNGGPQATWGPEATPEWSSQKSRDKPRKTCASQNKFLKTLNATLNPQ